MRKFAIYILAILSLAGCQQGQEPVDRPADKTSEAVVKEDTTDSAKDLQNDSVVAFKTVTKTTLENSLTIHKRFDGKGNDTLTLGNASLCVPAEGMTKEMVLSITPLDSAQLPKLPAGMKNVTTKGGGYRFLPHGEHFKRYAKVVLPYDSVRIPKGYTTKDIRTYYYDEQSGQWVVLPKDSINNEEQLASALTTHFTDMINGIITVPETPEAQGFAPTAMTDIKAADPSAGIMPVQAPSPNNNGTANIQIPFNFPAGRAGMGPEISVGYSSEGGSSWCGYGWSLSVPSISVETRWGVPVYDKFKETESYLFNGEQFTERVYREEFANKERTDNKHFYLRRESEFSEIIRKGYAPNNYEWEVRRLNGSIEVYTAIEKDLFGNIAKWGLSKKTDIHGNTVTYDYVLVDQTAYISEINYTGHKTEKGPYTIKFCASDNRLDFTSSGRKGFLQYDKQRLDTIQVLLNGSVFQSYIFNYKTGRFGKVLLTSVAATDGETELYRNRFKYKDPLDSLDMFSSPVELTTEVLPGCSKFRSQQDFKNTLNMLGAASSSGYSGGGGMNVGVLSLAWAGGNYNYSKTTTDGEVQFADIDGDNLPDKIYVSNGSVKYQKAVLTDDKSLHYETGKTIKGINSISYSVSESGTWGEDVGTGFWSISAGGSFTQESESSNVKIYPHDFNGDGLTDIAVNNVVFFNHLENGVPVFECHSTNTPYPIKSSNFHWSNPTDTVGLRKSLEEKFPLIDLVRSWRAPFSGIISYTAPITVGANSLDGIKYSVQLNKELLENGSLMANESHKLYGSHKVYAGDVLYFRLRSNYSGTGDECEWIPEIKYESMSIPLTNENGIDYTTYNAETDFIEGDNSCVGFGKPCKIKIAGVLEKGILSEDVQLAITRFTSTDTNEVLHVVLPAAEVIKKEITFEDEVKEGEYAYYKFSLVNNSQIDHSRLNWRPMVIRTNYLGYVDTTYYSPSRVMFNKVCKLSESVVLPSFEDTVNTYVNESIRLVLNLDGIEYTNGEKDIYAYLKEAGGSIIDTTLLDVSHLREKEIFASIASSSEINSCGESFMELHRTRKDSVFIEEDSIWVRQDVDTMVSSIPLSVYSVYDNWFFGPVFKGWGVLAVNGNKQDSIMATDFSIDKSKYENATSSEELDEDKTNTFGDCNTQSFFILSYDSNNQRFISGGLSLYVGRKFISSSRYGNPEIEIDNNEIPSGNYVMTAPYLMSCTKTTSNNAKLGLGVVGGGYGKSIATTRNTYGVLDINGDRFPDWIYGSQNTFSAYCTDGLGRVTKNNQVFQIFGVTDQKGYSERYNGSITLQSPSGDAQASTGVHSVKGLLRNIKNAAESNSHASIEASGSFAINNSWSEHEWIDVNGDGLPDYVYSNNGIGVHFNVGYNFIWKNDVLNIFGLSETKSVSNGAGLGISVTIAGRATVGGGKNFLSTSSNHNQFLMDMNGDGIPDIVSSKTIEFRSGNGCFDKVFLNSKIGSIGGNKSTVETYGGHAGATIPVWLITLSPHGNYSKTNSVSVTTSDCIDVNGDGLPDLVECDESDRINVRYNNCGGTNLLDEIITPMGAKINLEYVRTLNSYEMPNSRFVLSAVEVRGGNPENGATHMRSEFDYEDGHYDRFEREFLGFGKVSVKEIETDAGGVYRTSITSYSNTSYINRGLLQISYMVDNKEEVLNSTKNTYEEIPVANNNSVFQALVKVEKNYGTAGNFVKTVEEYSYDSIGNVIDFISSASDVIRAEIKYHNLNKLKNKRIPANIRIFSNSKLQRERSTTINPMTGDITEIRMENGDKPSIFNFEYDQYGNITKVTRPANEQGDRFWNKLTYDDVLHSLVVGIENAYGYSSSSEYDYRFGVPTKTTDINGQSITYEFDNFGRMTKVKAPYEDDYTIKFSYNPSEKTAKTFHYTLEGDIVTTTTSDDLMRPVKVEKTAVVNGSLGTVATGIVTYDAFGRTVREALPTLNGGQSAGFSETRYDAHDRKVEVILPDGSSTKMAYEVVNNGLKTTVTDAEGHVSEQYTDARQRTVKTVRKGDSEDIIVEYEFNPLGELLTVTHPNQTQTKYTYDQLGNKLSVDNPDAGLTKFTYDAVGNPVTKQTPNLSKISNGGYIKYIYDFERLSEVQYPVNVTNRIQYTYGERGDANNCAGRIKLVQDASGGTEFAYGKLGEIIKTTRSVMLSTADVRTYVSESEYDSWNRIRKMKYPDGETVTYGYDAAGQLISMESEKDNIRYKLIEDMQYDQYGNVTYKKYGNGTESYYTYDPMRQRLATMTALSKGNAFMDAKYSYDKIDNILGIENNAKPLGMIGGSYSHTYTYDAFSRLVSASGNCSKGVNYDLKMQYDIMSNPLRKTQKVTGSVVATSHDLEYTYGGSKPNAVQKVGNEAYTYDMNGNPTLIEGDTTYREMVWNEENRLMMLADEDYVSRYTYDYTGNRVIKSHGPMTTIYINGALQGVDFHDDENYTLYVSPFMTVNSDRFTKYYYAGTQRIASKIGSGKFDNVYGVNGFHLTAGQMDYAERAVEMMDGIKEFYKQSGVTPGVPNQLGQNANPYVSGVAYPSVPLGDYSVPAGWPGAVEKHGPGEVMGPPVWFKEEELPEAEAGVGFKSDYQRENDMFFFHTDHLGSTSYLTDTAGNVSQFVWYAPYGEALVDEHTAHYENPLKFSGKELDEITGLYDHGARNRNPVSTLWYGIDPLFEKYPDFSPYNYCAGNPVKLVDLDGRELQFLHYVRDDNNYDGGTFVKGMGENAKDRYEDFAKTQEGFDLLSKFAKAGQRIGSVKFVKDGEYSKHVLRISSYNRESKYAGNTQFADYNENSDVITFDVQIGTKRSEEKIDITLGHELFLHLDKDFRNYYNNRFTKERRERVLKEFNNNKNGYNDHKQYILTPSSFIKFRNYQKQLKDIRPKDKVDEAIKQHDYPYIKQFKINE